MLRFYGLRVLKDYIGHIILIGLPVVLITLMTMINVEASGEASRDVAALYIGVIYIIMFQGFGAAYTFEGIEHDFFKPFKDRLRAAPVDPMRFVLSNILFGIVTSYAQSLVILFYVMLVFGSRVDNLALVLIILLLGVVLAQLIAALVILLFKKAGKAQSFMTVYIIAAMVLAGFFFPLPSNTVTAFLSKYSSPLAWLHRAVYAAMEQDYSVMAFSLSLILLMTALVAALAYKVSKRVVV